MKNTDEVKWLKHLLKNGNVELRCFKDKNIISGIYNSIEPLIENIKQAVTDGWAVYNTLNPSTLIADNLMLRPYQSTTKNNDILRINTIIFDIDREKEGGKFDYYATTQQMDKIKVVADEIIALCEDWCWPKPVVGYSGNGIHLLWNTDIPLKIYNKYKDRLYDNFNQRFSKNGADFDTTVKNPARIARCLGTKNIKYGSKKTHCEYIDNFLFVEDFACMVKSICPDKKKPPSHFVKVVGENTNIRPDKDILSKLSALHPIGTGESGKYWINCINSGQHSTQGVKDTVFWLNPDGFYTYYCSHAHCDHINAKSLQDHLK